MYVSMLLFQFFPPLLPTAPEHTVLSIKRSFRTVLSRVVLCFLHSLDALNTLTEAFREEHAAIEEN